MTHRLAPEAETDLDDVWFYIASESGDVETADRFIDSLATRFYLLAIHPHVGRRRDEDLRRPGLRSFPVGRYIIFYRITVNDDVLILRVLAADRDSGALL